MEENSENGVVKDEGEGVEVIEEKKPEPQDIILKSEDVTIADIDALVAKFPNVRGMLAEIVLSRLLLEARAENAELKKPRAQRRREKAARQ